MTTRMSAKDIMAQLAEESTQLYEIADDIRIRLQDVLKTMLDDIHEVCIKHNIKYSLAGGTLLGAIRHKGFIPWDDDIDIVMPRRDWEMFKNVFYNELGEKYELEAPGYGDKDTKVTWGKIYKLGTTLMEIQDINVPYCKGIFVDVFILENVSNNRFVFMIDSVISDFLKGVATSMIYYKYPNIILDSFFGKTWTSRCYYLLRRFLGFVFSWCSHKRFCEFFDWFVSRHSEGKYVTVPTGRKNYKGELLDRRIVDSLQMVEFDNRCYCAFSDTDAILRNLYGDSYMIIPPENKRERHFVYKINF